VCECAEAGAACGKGRCRENTYKDRQEDLVACIDTHIHSISRTQIIVGFEEPKISRGYCDDGNTVNGDGCSRDCQEECGYSCSGGGSSSLDLCTTSCGDGLRVGAEECDHANNVNGDGCSSTCALEPGWICKSTLCGNTTCSHVCGDGRVVGNEQCDAGSGVAGCSSTCTVECGYQCSGGNASVADTCVTRSLSPSLPLSVCLSASLLYF
jgi:cysteine-rich repeat protein